MPAGAVTRLPAAQLPANLDESNVRVIKMAAARGQPASQHMTLGVNKAAVIELDADAKDVLVSSPDIVDAVVKTPRRVFLLGAKTGQSNAFFFDASGHQILSIDIRVEKDVTDLATDDEGRSAQFGDPGQRHE